MATLNELGSIIARCPGCNGGLSTFEWCHRAHDDSGRRRDTSQTEKFGRVVKRCQTEGKWKNALYLLLRCAGCGAGALAAIEMAEFKEDDNYPEGISKLLSFYPEARERLKLPEAVPNGIKNEFREAEKCLAAGCFRAAAGLFRSVLDKTMRANDYKKVGDLKKQIDAAADDGIITESRKKRAHEDIRVLGNDVLHDEWEPIQEEAVEAAHHYAQRILEDFYDDRKSTLDTLRSKGRKPEEDKPGT